VKTLLLLRHAKSAWSDPRLDDHDRPLNGRGERAARAMADHIARQGPRPDLILCSTAMRTNSLYLASEEVLLAHIRAVGDDVRTVLLIGHNDGIGQLAADLVGSGPSEALAALREKYPTGALAVLHLPDGPWSDLKLGSGKLLEFVRPRDLAVT
jgi:phosphohistidine phosphatase